MSTPDLYIQTSFVLDDNGRIVSTREPGAKRGPLITIVKSLKACAWAARADIPPPLMSEIERLAEAEPPAVNFEQGPAPSHRFIALLINRIAPG